MKTIGLIGGMSWESSKLYYEHINRKANAILGGSHSAKIIMVSVDFSEIEEWSFANNWDAIGLSMKQAAQQLERAGSDMILLGTNTIHLVSDHIVKNIQVPFIHIADTTGLAIQEKNIKKVALLGTRFTMEKDFYSKILKDRYQIESIIPPIDERQQIHDIIYEELVKGKFYESSRHSITSIIKTLCDQGAEGVILGCTELPILISEKDVEVPIFDTGKIHAFKAVEFAIEGNTTLKTGK